MTAVGGEDDVVGEERGLDRANESQPSRRLGVEHGDVLGLRTESGPEPVAAWTERDVPGRAGYTGAGDDRTSRHVDGDDLAEGRVGDVREGFRRIPTRGRVARSAEAVHDPSDGERPGVEKRDAPDLRVRDEGAAGDRFDAARPDERRHTGDGPTVREVESDDMGFPIGGDESDRPRACPRRKHLLGSGELQREPGGHEEEAPSVHVDVYAAQPPKGPSTAGPQTARAT